MNYKNNRIIQFLKNHIILIMLSLGVILALWATLSIEIPFIPKIPSLFSEEVNIGLNKIFLALAYSYLAGVIIYLLTSEIPYYRTKKQLFPVIEDRINDIGSHLSKMNLEFRDPDNNPDITEIDKVMEMFTVERWKEKCHIPDNLVCNNVTEAFIRDYRKLQGMVGQLIQDYKEYLSTNQLILLEKLRKDSIDYFLSIYEGSGNKLTYSDYFYDELLKPSYRDMLVTYKELNISIRKKKDVNVT